MRPDSRTMPEQASWSCSKQQPRNSQAETSRNGFETPTVERASKRPRLEQNVRRVPNRTPQKEVYRGHEGVNSRTRPTHGYDAAWARMVLSQTSNGSHLPVAEALASIQGIQPLTDEMYKSGTGKSCMTRHKGTGQGRVSVGLVSSLTPAPEGDAPDKHHGEDGNDEDENDERFESGDEEGEEEDDDEDNDEDDAE